MRHYRPRERRHDDMWEYTVDMGGLSYPVGYCMGLPDLEAESFIEALGSKTTPAYIYLSDYVNKHRNSYHSDGHATKEEACRCYRKYLMDSRLKMSVAFNDAPKKCQICGTLTYLMATLDAARYYLCDEHRNRMQVERLVPFILERFEL